MVKYTTFAVNLLFIIMFLLFCICCSSVILFLAVVYLLTCLKNLHIFWMQSGDLAKENDGHAFVNYLQHICTKHMLSQFKIRLGLILLVLNKNGKVNVTEKTSGFSFHSLPSPLWICLSVLQNITTFQKYPLSPLPCHIKENCEVNLRIRSRWSVIQALGLPSSLMCPLALQLWWLFTVRLLCSAVKNVKKNKKKKKPAA